MNPNGRPMSIIVSKTDVRNSIQYKQRETCKEYTHKETGEAIRIFNVDGNTQEMPLAKELNKYLHRYLRTYKLPLIKICIISVVLWLNAIDNVDILLKNKIQTM